MTTGQHTIPEYPEALFLSLVIVLQLPLIVSTKCWFWFWSYPCHQFLKQILLKLGRNCESKNANLIGIATFPAILLSEAKRGTAPCLHSILLNMYTITLTAPELAFIFNHVYSHRYQHYIITTQGSANSQKFATFPIFINQSINEVVRLDIPFRARYL